ncbi:phospholipase D-like domain-containing protein [Clostridium baratii]
MLYKVTNYPEDIQELIDNIEKEIKIQVIKVKRWNLPINKYKIDLEITKEAEVTIIEEFILKIALMYKGRYISINLIKEILNLDEVFIIDSIKNLLYAKSVETNNSKEIKITEIGERQLKDGKGLFSNKKKSVELFIQPNFKLFYSNINHKVSNRNMLNLNCEYEICDEIISCSNEFTKSIIKIVNNRDEVLINELRNEYISKINKISILDRDIAGEYIEFWIYDILEDRLYCRVWDMNSKVYVKELSDYITNNKPLNKEDFDLDLPMEFKDIDYDKRMEVSIYENKFKENIKSKNKEFDQYVRLIRGSKIKEEFNKCLQVAEKYLYIQSPWISEQVVDEDMINSFKKLVKRGCRIFISWGISRNFYSEDRKPSERLINRLKNIKSNDGTPGLFIYWIGNHHNKEIIVDDKMHLSGSFNWLSYRGDYLPRGESVYISKDIKLIKEAKIYLEEQIFNRICENIENMDYYEDINALINLQMFRDDVTNFILDQINLLISNKSDSSTEKIFKIVSVYLNNRVYDEVLIRGINELIIRKKYLNNIYLIINELKVDNYDMYIRLFKKYKLELEEVNIIKEA